ncbi:Uncharacterised protein [Bordetella pertussis]|nr:Uncharacterised protein [Bordetella pertussis]
MASPTGACAAVRIASPRFFNRKTRNRAGSAALALRPMVCTSSGPSWKVCPGPRVTGWPPRTPITIEPCST